MRYAAVLRVLFILYCIEAGCFLLLAPWSANWDRILIELPVASLRSVLLHPVTRGAVSGFGVVHLVWGAHDLEAWLSRWRLGGRPG